MSDPTAEQLRGLIDPAGTPGHEQDVQQTWSERVAPHADEVSEDAMGNAVAALAPDAPLRVMLAGHADEIGFIVRSINDEGFLSVSAIDIEPIVAFGQRVSIRCARGPVRGVVGQGPPYLRKDGDEDLSLDRTDFWVDIGARSRADAEALVAVGDPLVMEARLEPLADGRWTSRAFDDRLALHVMAEVLEAVAARRAELSVGLFCASTVQEEVGMRGSGPATYAIDPHVGIAIDVTHATDTPQTSPHAERIGSRKLGGGPVLTLGPDNNPVVVARLRAIAEAHGIPVQWDAVVESGTTDAGVMQLVRGGVATALVGIPLRYMHSPVEVVELEDVRRTVELLTHFVLELEADASFLPSSAAR